MTTASQRQAGRRQGSARSQRLVVVLGAGLMGAQIGLEYAVAGFDVALVTRTTASQERAIGRVTEAAHTLVRSHVVTSRKRDQAMRRVTAAADPGGALARAAIIVESVDEDFDLKVDVLGRAARANPDATLASNTSALSITNLGKAIEAESRLLGTHYWNPPTLMPLVELVAGEATDPGRVANMEAILRRLGKEPILVPDIPGFLWNRLQLALIREAVALVRAGVATPEVIDRIASRGFGRRWSVLGPFASMAAGGASTVACVADVVFPTLSNDARGDGIRALPVSNQRCLDTEMGKRDALLARQLLKDRKEPDAG